MNGNDGMHIVKWRIEWMRVVSQFDRWRGHIPIGSISNALVILPYTRPKKSPKNGNYHVEFPSA